MWAFSIISSRSLEVFGWEVSNVLAPFVCAAAAAAAAADDDDGGGGGGDEACLLTNSSDFMPDASLTLFLA